MQKAVGRERPRLWWCVTGELSFLPIHAAECVQGGTVERASDYFVSSYTPTLTSLTNARAGWHSIARDQVTGIVAGCRDAPRTKRLHGVEEEVDATVECFKKGSANILNTPRPNTTSEELLAVLNQEDATILHLACHGVQDPNPLQSAFLLSNGRLTIEHIMRLRLPRAVLAFLSACQTAKGSQNQPDQAVHLAASMLFCGFRSVVGTMW
jgi:CHAT domain-containing protein